MSRSIEEPYSLLNRLRPRNLCPKKRLFLPRRVCQEGGDQEHVRLHPRNAFMIVNLRLTELQKITIHQVGATNRQYKLIVTKVTIQACTHKVTYARGM